MIRPIPRLLGGSFAVVVLAAAPAAAQTLVRYEEGEGAGDGYGWTVCAAGDVNKDGVPDYAVGAPRDDDGGAQAGSVVARSGVDGSILHRWDGGAAGDELGFALAAGFDANGDGHADLVVGAPGDDTNGADAGAVFVFSGRAGGLLYAVYGASPGSGLGTAVAGAGDVDGDGKGDFVVGQPELAIATVYSGATGAVLHQWSDQPSTRLGYAVAGAGDVDLDGHDDVLVGAPEVLLFERGRAYVYSGADGSVLHEFLGGPHSIPETDNLGACVAGVGDVDLDGRPDVAVGTDTSSLPFVAVYSGLDGHELLHLPGGYGPFRVAGGADFDGDGRPDVAVGIQDGRGGAVYSGLDGSLLFEFSAPPGYYNGNLHAVALQPDTTGDGRGELLVGAGFGFLGAGPNGRTWVMEGGRYEQGTTYCAGKVNSQGCEPSLNVTGYASASYPAGYCVVDAFYVVTQQPGLFFYGLTSASTPFGGGTMCVAAPVVRTPRQGSGGTSATCGSQTGRFSFDLGEYLASGADPALVPGVELFGQFWYRDPADPTGPGLTEAIRVPIYP